MSIVGIFTKTRPDIGGIFFDAILEESSELQTDVSEYPLENASTANDNAVTRPMYLTMTVSVSDNPIKTLMAEAGELSGVLGIGAGITAGIATSMLSGGAAALAGLGASIGLGIASTASSKRSVTVLEAMRSKQRESAVMTVVSSKGSYTNMIITSTRQETNKENEVGLELVVEMRQLVIINKNSKAEINNANLPANDSATTQGQSVVNRGEVIAQ